MKSKKWIFVLCSFLASFFLVACQSGSNGSQSAVEAIKQKGKLVVATSPDYAPFEFQSLVDGKNQVVGADIDMAQACLLYTSPSPRDRQKSRMPSSA